MGKLYYDLTTNVTVQKEGLFPTLVDLFIFQTVDGNYLEVESQGREEFTNNNGDLSGEWQDHVMYRRLDASFNEIDEEFLEIDRDTVFEALISDPATKLIGFRVDEESLDEHGYAADFVPECTEASITIVFSGLDDVKHIDFSATSLLTDGQIETAVHNALGRGGN